MANPLEDYVIERLHVKVPSTSIVRYTDFSWGGKTILTSTIHGKTYKELVDSIELSIDAMINSRRSQKINLIGVRLNKINNGDEEELGFYVNFHFGDIQGGNGLYYKLKEEIESRQK